jgi:hypothetical protein
MVISQSICFMVGTDGVGSTGSAEKPITASYHKIDDDKSEWTIADLNQPSRAKLRGWKRATSRW